MSLHKISILLIYLIFLFSASITHAVEGCLVGNSFYTTYLGLVRSGNNSFNGDKKVFNFNGARSNINYSGTNSCGTVTAPNGGIPRNGDLCFVLTQSTYNSYPLVSGTGGTVRRAPNYPPNNGTLQNFDIYYDTSCPIDDYVPVFVSIFTISGFLYLRNFKTII